MDRRLFGKASLASFLTCFLGVPKRLLSREKNIFDHVIESQHVRIADDCRVVLKTGSDYNKSSLRQAPVFSFCNCGPIRLFGNTSLPNFRPSQCETPWISLRCCIKETIERAVADGVEEGYLYTFYNNLGNFIVFSPAKIDMIELTPTLEWLKKNGVI
jgi:hypothetical protein